MRSSAGGAAGYTDDIASAGIFDEEKARQYHDPPPYRRDEAVPFAKAFDKLEARLGAMTAERDAFANKIATAKAVVAQRAAEALSGRSEATSPQTDNDRSRDTDKIPTHETPEKQA